MGFVVSKQKGYFWFLLIKVDVMKTKLILSAFALFIFSISTYSCKKAATTNCGNNFNFGVELQEEAMALSNAASVYAQNQTTENCNNYKNAVQNYLNSAKE